jgi:hypothetical protein
MERRTAVAEQYPRNEIRWLGLTMAKSSPGKLTNDIAKAIVTGQLRNRLFGESQSNFIVLTTISQRPHMDSAFA